MNALTLVLFSCAGLLVCAVATVDRPIDRAAAIVGALLMIAAGIATEVIAR